MDGYVSKPIDLKALLREIEAAVSQRAISSESGAEDVSAVTGTPFSCPNQAE